MKKWEDGHGNLLLHEFRPFKLEFQYANSKIQDPGNLNVLKKIKIKKNCWFIVAPKSL